MWPLACQWALATVVSAIGMKFKFWPPRSLADTAGKLHQAKEQSGQQKDAKTPECELSPPHTLAVIAEKLRQPSDKTGQQNDAKTPLHTFPPPRPLAESANILREERAREMKMRLLIQELGRTAEC